MGLGGFADGLGPVARNHDGMVWVEHCPRLHRVDQQGRTGDLMQNLGQV